MGSSKSCEPELRVTRSSKPPVKRRPATARPSTVSISPFNPQTKGDKAYSNITKFLQQKGPGFCNHYGPCSNSDCICVENKTTCGPVCGCWPSCVRKFPNCNCDGKCTRLCPCVRFRRECMPGSCGCTDCANWFPEQKSAKVFFDVSTVLGDRIGLFAAHKISNGQCIGSYSAFPYRVEEEGGVSATTDAAVTEYRTKLYEISRGTYLHPSILHDILSLTLG